MMHFTFIQNSATASGKVFNGFLKLALSAILLLIFSSAFASMDYEDFETLNGIIPANVPDFTIVKPLSATAFVNGTLKHVDAVSTESETTSETIPLSGQLMWCIPATSISNLKFSPGALSLSAYFYAENTAAELQLRTYNEDNQFLSEHTLSIGSNWKHVKLNFPDPVYRIELENFSSEKIAIDDILTQRLDYTPEALAARHALDEKSTRAIFERDPFSGEIRVNVGGVSVRVGNGVTVQVGNLVSVNVGNGVSVQVGGVSVAVGNGVRVVVGGNAIIDTIGRDGGLQAPQKLGAGVGINGLLFFTLLGLTLSITRNTLRLKA